MSNITAPINLTNLPSKGMNIFQSINAVMKQIGSIAKGQKNTSQGYSFRGIDDMYNAVHPLFAEHGIFLTSETLNTEREERQTKSGGTMIYSIMDIRYTFYAIDGTSVSTVTRGEGSDTGDKASNKAMSTALKYALIQLLLIPTSDVKDSDSDSPEFVAKAQTHPQKKEDTRPWLNPQENGVNNPNYVNAFDYLASGQYTLEQVEKKYRLNKEVRNDLQMAVNLFSASQNSNRP
jgi:hypothetical protein